MINIQAKFTISVPVIWPTQFFAIKLHYTARVPFKTTTVAHFQVFGTYSVCMTHFPKLLHTSQGTETDTHEKT